MKNIILIMFFLAAIASCRPEFEDIGEPVDRAAGLSGTWTLSSVIQVDEKAVSKGYPDFVQRIELTERAGFNDYQLVLNQSDSGNPSSFEERATDAPTILGISQGSWSLDDPDYPKEITFTNPEGGSFTLIVGTYLGLSEGELNLSFSRMVDEEPIVTYEYKFIK
ncbi:DUF5004 domain-containing protein [Marivirga sp. S37H4]|uniref:DUF5004 domain-containing protein n=1 Tax=Marivirga aurantiaca TaxID=2802615 RepID=A0A934X1J1_9BACT|nr:DUF5004 domain-containing protein [Marivirga aurantiaca]MBK6267278.1 DUF5004 domain-containing protein [Marivirga aurantiaca]